MASKKKLLQAAAGSAGGGGSLDVDEVFSTYLYDGTGSALTINNGLDLSGEGGLVWTKRRDHAGNGHMLVDTARGGSSFLKSNTTDAANTSYTLINSFNSNGYTLSTNGWVNGSGDSVCSWTFRKAPKFFQCLTYTGDGQSSKTISHSLNTTVGMMIVKCTNTTGDWHVFHRSGGSGNGGYLNGTDAFGSTSVFPSAPTSTNFSVAVATNAGLNKNNNTYVAYLFAHNDGDGDFGPDGDQDVIKCGSFTSDSSGIATVNLGFEPQWLMFKGTHAGSSWHMVDVMRGMSNGSNDAWLAANLNNAEASYAIATPTPTGFVTDGTTIVDPSSTFIYMAIRRGPLAEPTSATDVFHAEAGSNSSDFTYNAGFPVDMMIYKERTTINTGWGFTWDRLRGSNYLRTNDTNAETAYSSSGNPVGFDEMTFVNVVGQTTNDKAIWNWKRAPSYFDCVCYSGTQVARTISHNLGLNGTVPEMIWVKNRDGTTPWMVYHSALGNQAYLQLNSTAAAVTGNTSRWNATTPTASVFSLGDSGSVNGSGSNYIAYLFATVAGVSKVGSYTGDGTNSKTIDCGFSSGARFVLIKRTSGIGSWITYDTERGITASDDPFLYLDTNAAENTISSFDIDPHSSGFTLGGSGSYINASGQSYIFYAIA